MAAKKQGQTFGIHLITWALLTSWLLEQLMSTYNYICKAKTYSYYVPSTTLGSGLYRAQWQPRSIFPSVALPTKLNHQADIIEANGTLTKTRAGSTCEILLNRGFERAALFLRTF